MGTIHVREFTGGLDARRLPETTEGGALIRGYDVVIDRGRQVRKRAAFVPVYTLPKGRTVGAFPTRAGITVFGHGTRPDLPPGIRYLQIQHPDGKSRLLDVPSAAVFQKQVYSVGVFGDGEIHHYLNGSRVTAWFDGRASTVISITGGGAGGAVTSIRIAGVEALGASVSWTTDINATAAAVAAQINGYASLPEYSAVAEDNRVVITATTAGDNANGRAVVVTTSGSMTYAQPNGTAMVGGSDLEAAVAAAPAKATVKVLSGSPGAKITSVKINNVNVISGTVTYPATDAGLAAALANAVNAHSSSPEYRATAAGAKVTIEASLAGTAANGRVLTLDVEEAETSSGTFEADALAGGSNTARAKTTFRVVEITGGTPKITSIKVDGREIATDKDTLTIPWAGSAASTAQAIVDRINARKSVPEYTATRDGAVVTISAKEKTGRANGRRVFIKTSNIKLRGGSIALEWDNQLTRPFSAEYDVVRRRKHALTAVLAGGVDAVAPEYTPGRFVKTIDRQMFALSGPNLHKSRVGSATKWTAGESGAAVYDLSTTADESEELVALSRYQQNVVVFSGQTAQIWYFDPDPALAAISQVLNNTGAIAARSVTQFGDSDIFYLDSSGVRSLRARATTTNNAATTDIGSAIDDLILDHMDRLDADTISRAIGVIDPRDGRYWLALGDLIYVFNFFTASKVSAWTILRPGFVVEEMFVYQRRIWLRSGDTIYAYGGAGPGFEHDATVAEVWLPYLDANTPAIEKTLDGVDVACRGTWQVSVGMNPNIPDAEDIVATVDKTTMNEQRIPATGKATSFSLRFRTVGSGAATLSSALLHFTSDAEEDS